MRLALWLSLVAPSIFIVERFFGWPGVVAHAVIAAIALPYLLRLPLSFSPAVARRYAIATGVVLAIVFVVGYRTFDIDLPERGSDDDEAHEIGAWALIAGENPYAKETYLGNWISPMPGALILGMPFVVVGSLAAQNLFWLLMFFLAARREAGDERRALGLFWAAIVVCLPVIHDLVTGNSHVANAIYVLLALLWVVRSRGSALASVCWGVTLASRANFFFLVPCALGWLWRRVSPAAALRAAALTLTASALLILPFYLSDPDGFTPLSTARKLRLYDNTFPGASVAIAIATGVIAIAVGARAQTRAGLFAGCALVQAVPVVSVAMLSFLAARPYPAALAYGEFATWFMVMSVAIAAAVATSADPRAATRVANSDTLSPR